MPALNVRPARNSDLKELVRLRALLWPDASVEEHSQEVALILKDGMCGTQPAAIFVLEGDNESVIGFLDVDLRSHADGCDPARPVGYVEGWFVEEPFRHRGLGRKLVRAAEDWARGQGCREIASDTWIDNEGSQRAHEALGFEVVDRCVHYRKWL